MRKKTKKEVVSQSEDPLRFMGRLERIQRDGLHKVASRDFELAMLYMIQALNLCENQTIPWSLTEASKARADALCRELTELFHDNLIPRIDRLLNRRDPAFQRFLGDLTS